MTDNAPAERNIASCWDETRLPLEDALEVVKWAVMYQARPIGSEVVPNEFTVTRAEAKLVKQESVCIEDRLVGDVDSGKARWELKPKIGRRAVSLAEAAERYAAIVAAATETEDSFQTLEYLRCTARKATMVGGSRRSYIEITYGSRLMSGGNRETNASVLFLRDITSRLFVAQSLLTLTNNRRGRRVETLESKSGYDVFWGQERVRLKAGWLQALQSQLEPELPFADIDVDLFFSLLERELRPSDVIEGAEGVVNGIRESF